jgi:hypothetical protein
MARWVAQTLRASVILGVLWAGGAAGAGSAGGAAGDTRAPGMQGQDATPYSSIRPEVRLRKLHLVRPDLIPYPIAFEVVC